MIQDGYECLFRMDLKYGYQCWDRSDTNVYTGWKRMLIQIDFEDGYEEW